MSMKKVWLSEGSDRFAYLPEYRVDPLYRGRSVQMAGRRSDEDGLAIILSAFFCSVLFVMIQKIGDPVMEKKPSRENDEP